MPHPPGRPHRRPAGGGVAHQAGTGARLCGDCHRFPRPPLGQPLLLVSLSGWWALHAAVGCSLAAQLASCGVWRPASPPPLGCPRLLQRRQGQERGAKPNTGQFSLKHPFCYNPTAPCCSYDRDKWGVKSILENWLQRQQLARLPVFALGVSAGASFALKLPKITRVNGVISGAPLWAPVHAWCGWCCSTAPPQARVFAAQRCCWAPGWRVLLLLLRCCCSRGAGRGGSGTAPLQPRPMPNACAASCRRGAGRGRGGLQCPQGPGGHVPAHHFCRHDA